MPMGEREALCRPDVSRRGPSTCACSRAGSLTLRCCALASTDTLADGSPTSRCAPHELRRWHIDREAVWKRVVSAAARETTLHLTAAAGVAPSSASLCRCEPLPSCRRCAASHVNGAVNGAAPRYVWRPT